MAARIWNIALNTFRENRRDRVLYALVAFASVLILAGIAAGELSPFEQSKILLDLGQAAMLLVGSLIAIFLGISLISKEIERRTIYVVLSKPIGRGEFLVGKTLGLTLTLTAAFAVMALVLAVVAWAYGAPPTLALAQSMIFLWAQSVVLVTVSVLFASFVSSSTLAAILSLSCWIIGQVAGDLHQMSERASGIVAKVVFGALYWALPNLSLFDAKARGTYGVPVAAGEFLSVLAYGLAYASFLLVLASLAFSRRDLR